jgi:hypothetical protein
MKKEPKPKNWLQNFWELMCRKDSIGLLVCTALQALLALMLIGLAKLSHGLPLAEQVRWMMLVAIVATWCLALRTIREMILEFAKNLRVAYEKLLALKKEGAPEFMRFRPFVLGFLRKNTHKAILYLRIIAMGLTLPFLILPLVVAVLSFFLAWRGSAYQFEFLALGLILGSCSWMVFYYFRWSIVAQPQPALAQARLAEDQHASRRETR